MDLAHRQAVYTQYTVLHSMSMRLVVPECVSAMMVVNAILGWQLVPLGLTVSAQGVKRRWDVQLRLVHLYSSRFPS